MHTMANTPSIVQRVVTGASNTAESGNFSSELCKRLMQAALANDGYAVAEQAAAHQEPDGSIVLTVLPRPGCQDIVERVMEQFVAECTAGIMEAYVPTSLAAAPSTSHVLLEVMAPPAYTPLPRASNLEPLCVGLTALSRCRGVWSWTVGSTDTTITVALTIALSDDPVEQLWRLTSVRDLITDVYQSQWGRDIRVQGPITLKPAQPSLSAA